MFSSSDIAKHYEFCELHYRTWWNLKQSRSMHYGFWDETTKNLHDALMNINKVMSGKAGISPAHRVLDAGCGVGGSSLWLAKNIGCHVTGITLSKKQRDQAEEYAAKHGLSEKANFLQADYTNTGLPDGSFDVVWAIESVCHADDKSAFLKEAYRLLKPGGTVIVADFFKIKGLTDAEKELIHQMAYGWAITDFSTIEDFESFATDAGFKHLKIENISKAILPSAKRLYWVSFPGILITKLYDLFFKASELSKYNARTINVQYRALKKGLWKYQLFTARK